MGFGICESQHSSGNRGFTAVAFERFHSIFSADLMPWRNATVLPCFKLFSEVLEMPSRANCTKHKLMCIIRSIKVARFC